MAKKKSMSAIKQIAKKSKALSVLELIHRFHKTEPNDETYAFPALNLDWSEGQQYPGKTNFAWLAATVHAIRKFTGKDVIVYEIGVFAGESAQTFLYAGAFHYNGIDNWVLNPVCKEVAPSALNGMRRLNYTIIEKDSQMLMASDLPPILNEQVMLFSVDGSHETAEQSRDMEFAFNFMRSGDVMIVDDFTVNPKVAEVVETFLNKHAVDLAWHTILPSRKGFFVAEKL